MNSPEGMDEFSWLISCSNEDFEREYKQLHEKNKSNEENYKGLQLRHVLLGEKSCKIAQREAILRNQVIVLEELHKNPEEASQNLHTKYKELQEELLIQANCIGEITSLAQQINIENDKNKAELCDKNATIEKQREEFSHKNQQITVLIEENEKQSKLISTFQNEKSNWKETLKEKSVTFDQNKEISELKKENIEIVEKLGKTTMEIEELRENDVKHRRNVNLLLDSMKILKTQLSSKGIFPFSTPADNKFGNKSTSPYPSSSYQMSPGLKAPVFSHSNTQNSEFDTQATQKWEFDSQAAQNWTDLQAERKKNKELSLEIKALSDKIVHENGIAKKNEKARNKAVNLMEQKSKKYREILERNQKESKEKQEFDLEIILEKNNEIVQLRNEIEENNGKQEFDKGLIEGKNVEIGELRNEIKIRKKTSEQIKLSYKQFEECKMKEIQLLELDLKNLKKNNMQLIADIKKLETRLATETENKEIEQQAKIKILNSENGKLQVEIQNNRQKWQKHQENLRSLKSSIPNVQQFQDDILDYMRNGNWALEKDILDIKNKLIDWSNNYRFGVLEERIDSSDEIANLQQKLSVVVAQNKLQADDFVQLSNELKSAKKRTEHMQVVQISEDKYNEFKAKRARH